MSNKTFRSFDKQHHLVGFTINLH